MATIPFDINSLFFLPALLPSLLDSPLDFMLVVCVMGLLFLCLSMAVTGPAVAFFAEAAGLKSGRAFPLKLGRQVAGFALPQAVLLVAAEAALLWVILKNAPDPLALLWHPHLWPVTTMLCAALVAALLLALYVLTWKKNGTPGGGHLCPGGLAMLAALASGIAILAAIMRFMQFAETAAGRLDDILLLFQAPPLLAMLVYMFFLAAATAHALAALKVIQARRRNDSGRDYYAFALPYCARGATSCTFLSLLCFAAIPILADTPYEILWTFTLFGISSGLVIVLSVLCYALPALACVFWIVLLRSATPLRHKPGLSLAFFCLFGGICVQCFVLPVLLGFV